MNLRLWKGASRVAAGQTLLAAVLYLGYALFVTWPLVLHPGSDLSGTSVAGDLGGSVSLVNYVVQHHVFPFAPAVLHGLNAPQGLQQTWVENWASFPSNVLLFGTGYLFGGVGGSNVFLWLSYVATGMSMFLLIRRLYGSFGAALLAGFAFAFFPWAVDKLNGHYQYMDGWVLVLSVWRMLELAQRPTVRNALLGGAATALGMWWTPYFILIGGVGFVVMCVTVIAAAGVQGRLRRGVGLIALASGPIAMVFIGLGLLAHFAGGTETGSVRVQSLSALYTYSARGLEWVLPDRNNLIFGGRTGPYLLGHLHGSNFSESSLYLGDSVILLAIGGGILAVRAYARDRRAAWSDPRLVATSSGILLAVAAGWFSAPPKVRLLGVWIPTPSDVIYHFTSTFRVYTRFVELFELGLCLAMGWALAAIVDRPRVVARLTTLTVLAVVLRVVLAGL